MATSTEVLRSIFQQQNRVDMLVGFELGIRCATEGPSSAPVREVCMVFSEVLLRNIIRAMAVSGEMRTMKFQMTKVVRELTTLDLKQATSLVDSVVSQL